MPGKLEVGKHYVSITVNTGAGGMQPVVQLENSPPEMVGNFLLWVVEERIFEASVYNSFWLDTHYQDGRERRIRNYDFVDRNSVALGGADPFNGGLVSSGHYFVGRSSNNSLPTSRPPPDDPIPNSGRVFLRSHFNPQTRELSVDYEPPVGLPRAMEYEYTIARLFQVDTPQGWQEHDRVRVFDNNIVDFVRTITTRHTPGISNNRIRRA